MISAAIIYNFWTSVIFVLVIVMPIGLILNRRYARKLLEAQEFLRYAKQETEEMAQLPLNNPHPMIQIAADGEIIFTNAASLEKFTSLLETGLQHEALRGLNFSMEASDKFAREITYGNTIYHQTIMPAIVGDHTSYIVYCYDITERKEFEKELKKANLQAQQARIIAEKANQARGDFLANMSHELRTPMNGIIGLSGILAEAGLKQEHRDLAEAVNSSACNLLIILNDILDFSKIEAGELTLEFIPFELRDVVKQIVSLQAPIAARKGLAIKSEISENVPQVLIGDPARLQQILNNLIGNSMKFTEKGSVTVSISGHEDGCGNFIVLISVIDTGIGIPEDKQLKIFSRFQQADSSTARKYGGTGLGLSIVKNLTELMGGTISLKSAVGCGSEFTLNLSLKIAEKNLHDADNESERHTQPVRINTDARIMVVDDHPINLLYMRHILTKLGFKNFCEASSGKQALELIEKDSYDLILLDRQMPDMDGCEVARRIRELQDVKRKPVIIAVTADAMKGAEEKCVEMGMDGYISKPVEKNHLIAVLQRWLPGDTSIVPDDLETVNSSGIFDWNQLHDITGGEPELEKQAIQIFLENLEIDIGNMRRSFKNGNFSQWNSIVHKIYGSCAHLGANAMAEICDEAQSLPAGSEVKIEALHKAALIEFEKLSSFLRNNKDAA